MINRRVNLSDDIIDKYIELNNYKRIWLSQNESTPEFHFDKFMREELLKVHKNESYIVDVLIEHLYTINSKYKNGLWDTFGHIIYENLFNNIGYTIQCEVCNNRVEKVNENQIYCDECSKEKERESWRLSKRKQRMSKLLNR